MEQTKNQPAQAEPLEVRVMTFNIRHGKGLNNKVNLERTSNVIKEANVDIVSLQEVDRYLPRSGFNDQIGRLAKNLKMYWCFSLSVGRGLSQYGNAILSKHPILEHHKIYLPGARERRSLLQATIQMGDNSRPLHVITTHLGVTAGERKQQFPLILEKLSTIKGPAIFMGDLNMDSRDPLLKDMFPAWQKIHLNPPVSTFITGKEIDHIYLNCPVMSAKGWTISSEASDHFPVVAQLPLNMIHYSRYVGLT
ncbi:MAG TPA: endonuclease/exonuclease/phosphatase family protein [Bacilli bacterium]